MSITKRLNGITIIPDRYRNAILPAPKSAKLELVARCNYSCAFCAATLRKQKLIHDMDFELFKKITKDMRGVGVEEFGVFYIGESFMNPNLLVKAIDYLKRELTAPYVFITTNGSLTSPLIVEQCMQAGLDSLKWSCNAANEEQFESLFGVPSKWLIRVTDNIRNAWEIRAKGAYKTGLYASSIKYNDEQLKKAEPFLKKYVLPYVDEHYWLPLYTAGGLAKEKEYKLGMQPIAGNTGRLDNPVDPLPCWTLFTATHVMVDGRMTACCLDGTGRWVMGDLKEQNFMDIWNSPKFVKLREAHLNKDVLGTVCEKCAMVS